MLSSSRRRNVAAAAARGRPHPADRRPLPDRQPPIPRRARRRLRAQRRRLRGPAAAVGRDRGRLDPLQRAIAAARWRRSSRPSPPPRTSTPIAKASCRPRASPLPIAAKCSRRLGILTNASTPARMSSSTTASVGPACRATSRRAPQCGTSRATRSPSSSARWSATAGVRFAKKLAPQAPGHVLVASIFVPALFLGRAASWGPLLASAFGPLWFVYLGSLAAYALLTVLLFDDYRLEPPPARVNPQCSCCCPPSS